MANNEFEKDFFKLMNSAVFGKTMENLPKRLIVQLANSQSKARKLTSKPSFHAFRIFNEDLLYILTATFSMRNCAHKDINIELR